MVKLDSIFKALGIETENDVRLLAQYFVDHHRYKELIKNKSFARKNSTSPISESNEEEPVNEKIVPTDIIKLIHPNEVLTALKTFVTLHHKASK